MGSETRSSGWSDPLAAAHELRSRLLRRRLTTTTLNDHPTLSPPFDDSKFERDGVIPPFRDHCFGPARIATEGDGQGAGNALDRRCS